MSRPEAATSVVDCALALRRVLGLEELEPELLTTLAARAEIRRHGAGEPLAAPDDSTRAIHLVLEGSVRERFSGAPERSVGPGGLVGDLASLAGDPRPTDSLAAEESLTLTLRNEDLVELCEEHFALLLAVMRSIARSALAAPRREPAGAEPLPPEATDARAELDLGGRIALLAASPMLRGVRVATLGQLAQDARLLRLGRGQVLWRLGDPSEAVVWVAQGALEERSPGHRRANGPGALVGLAETIAGVPRGAEAEARTAVAALRIEISALLDALEDDSGLALDVLAALAQLVAPSASASA